jgi:hypothetical protein
MSCVENVERMGRRGMRIGYWREGQKERKHWEDRNVGEWILDRMGLCGLD